MGVFVEVGEVFLDRAELAFDANANLFEGARGNLVLQPFELGTELFREKVGEDREQLPDLDEQALELENGGLDPPRVLAMDRGDALLPIGAAEDSRLEAEPQVTEDDLEGGRISAKEAPAAGRGARDRRSCPARHGPATPMPHARAQRPAPCRRAGE